MTANRWLWAAGFLLLFPSGIGLCLLSLMSVQHGLSSQTHWSMPYPTRFAVGMIVLALALLSLRGYIVRLKSDLRVTRERKAEHQ